MIYFCKLILLNQMNMKVKIVLLVFVLCISACKTQTKTSASSPSADMKADQALVEKYWKLVELNGNPLTVSDHNEKEAHIIFKNETNRFSGSAGCNRITGVYNLEKSGGIAFSQTIVSRMMCLNMDIETQFLQVLETADTYTVGKDTLVLSKEKTPLARFVVVYLK